ncbi:MAG: efflux RND transporter permease subunit, partial [Proteobacteria bacterium]|nr:efflux RND transporter permease subunit [Pseudomonadota bacterium]
MNLTIVRFYVGEDMENSIVNLYNKLMANFDKIPPGVTQPLVKPKSIDDVPILTLTLWDRQERYSGYELRRIATELADELKKDQNVSEFSIIGGQKRQVAINLDQARLKAYQTSSLQIMQALQQTNFMLHSGAFPAGNQEFIVETGGFLTDMEDVASVVVGIYNGQPVYLQDVAELTDGPEEPANYVFMGLGPAAAEKGLAPMPGQFEAVTIALSKKKGANASTVAHKALAKMEALKGKLIPSDLQVTVTRDYGETAKEKSDELLKHMLIATVSVIILIAFTLGWREAVVVGVAVPVTLSLTLLITYLYGYTLNRVTLFALIFSIGILVDDAIVVVENIHRHFKMHRINPLTAVLAVDEVGSPTILATFAVIAALMPMAFVSGLMGPYMRPIPVGASAAMLFSLLVAFIVTPWLSYMVLKNVKHDTKSAEKDSRLLRIYEKLIGPLLDSPAKRLVVLLLVGVLLGMAMLLVPFKKVTVKMLPFDNKSELQVIIDMPEGSTLEDTAAATRDMTEFLKTVPEITDYQAYIGTAAPYNFNGLVRHYFLRSGSNVAELQVNFVAKENRAQQSHDLAKRLRPPLKEIGDRYGAS